MIDAVVFDFDGLIVDTETPLATTWDEIYADHGVAFDWDGWRSIIGTTGDAIDPLAELEVLVGGPVDRDAVTAHRRTRVRELLDVAGPLPGVVERIEEARQLGLGLAIASSSPTWWVVRHLTRVGLSDAFDVLSCADDPADAKPAPTVYVHACRVLGADPARSLAIEDSPHGVAAAKAAGLRCVAVPNRVTEAGDFTAADRTVRSLADHTLVELAEEIA